MKIGYGRFLIRAAADPYVLLRIFRNCEEHKSDKYMRFYKNDIIHLYVEQAEYTFEERSIPENEWYCTCSSSGIEGWSIAAGKVKAKKKAAFMVLVRLLDSAGLATEGMKEAMWKTLDTVGVETCTAERGTK